MIDKGQMRAEPIQWQLHTKQDDTKLPTTDACIQDKRHMSGAKQETKWKEQLYQSQDQEPDKKEGQHLQEPSYMAPSWNRILCLLS